MITFIAVAALLAGLVIGWGLASRFMLRTLAAVIIAASLALVLIHRGMLDAWVSIDLQMLAALCAPPLVAGALGGAVSRWLFRTRGDAS